MPRVLIIGEVFGPHGGGGITLGKLFDKWPSKCLAIAEMPYNLAKNDYIKCQNCYSLGHLEKVYFYPFNRLFRQHQSQPIYKKSIKSVQNNEQENARNWCRSIILKKVLHVFNLDSFYISNTSNKFLEWVTDFKPSYIYVQPNAPFKIEIVNQLHSVTKIPYIVHVMDDYITSWYDSGIFSPLLRRKLSKSVRVLFSHAFKRVAICEHMAVEYSKKYKVHFEYIHNSISIERWRNAIETLPSEKVQERKIKLLHLGRISFPVLDSLMLIAKAVENLNRNNFKVELHIYSFDYSSETIELFSTNKAVYLYPPVEHEQVPLLINQHDVLLLPLDFNKKAVRYTRLSFSTKAPEFMASGKPIIVLAPKESALSIHAQKYGWAAIVNHSKTRDLENAITNLLSDMEMVNKIIRNAMTYAIEHCDDQKVSQKFANLFPVDLDFKKHGINN